MMMVFNNIGCGDEVKVVVADTMNNNIMTKVKMMTDVVVCCQW